MTQFNPSAPRRPSAAVQFVTSRGEKGAKGDPGDPSELIADVPDGKALAKVGGAVVGIDVATPSDVAAAVAPKADQTAVQAVADRFDSAGKLKDAAVPSSVARSSDLSKRLIGGVRSTVDGSPRPTRGLYALEDPANPGEIVDLVLGDVA